jgi:hypothetical protein
MLNYKMIDGVEIPFDIEWTSVAVSLSGGADSALLAYLLCDFIASSGKDITVHIISHTRMWKTRPWQGHDSLNVYHWLVKKFSNIKFKRHTNFIAPELEHGNIGASLIDEYGKQVSGDNIEQRAFAEYICHHHDVDAYFNAVTHNPRGVNFQGMPSRDIEPTNDNKHLLIMEHMGRLASHPLRFTEKSWVMRQYRQLALLDLLKLTRSCEGEFPNITYKNYIQGQSVPLCNECFWCKERAWAIEQSK